jgi:hypothetical protein
MASRRSTEASIIPASTGAVTTPVDPEVFEQSTDNNSTGAVELLPEGTTTAAHFADAFTVSYADPGPIVVANSWRGEVVAKVIEPPAEETPIFAAAEAETKEIEGGDSTETAPDPE